MSLRTKDNDQALAYANRRIGDDHNEVLVVFCDGETIYVTTIDSEMPREFKTIGTFYWDDEINAVVYKSTATL